MSSYSGTPVLHHVFNELDQHGLLFDLKRLENEGNAAYKQRLLDVMVHKAGSNYMGLIYGITRELGLEIQDTLEIIPQKDGNGNFLAPVPAIIFDETKCTLYTDFSEKTVLASYDRFDSDGGAWTLGELVTAINLTSEYSATILNNMNEDLRSMTIFNQKSYDVVPFEDISGSGVVIKLENNNIVENSLVVSSSNLFNLVSTQIALTKRGDFYVDYEAGIIYSYAVPSPGDAVRYQFVKDDFIVQSSPVILHNLQSIDFQTKMFEQILDGENEYINGLPTALGADIINELLSLYPVTWGK